MKSNTFIYCKVSQTYLFNWGNKEIEKIIMNVYNRQSIRLKGYDYSQAGLYFVTICCQGSMCLFGETTDHKMILNDAGQMIQKWYFELEHKFTDIQCHEMIIMPNHFHCIIEIVGADLRVCPNDRCVCPNDRCVCPNDLRVCPNETKHGDKMGEHRDIMGEHRDKMGEHIGSPLHRVVQWFKTMSTNEYIRGVKKYNWVPFNQKLWQRNYYEHIIRNEKSYQNIAEYIINNPARWHNDTFYTN